MRKRVFIPLVVLILVVTSGCGGGGRRAAESRGASDSPVPTAAVIAAAPTTARSRATNTSRVSLPTAQRPTSAPRPPTATPVPPTPQHRAITFNDYVPEQKNYVDTICIVVNFAGKPERVFDLRKYWDRIFGLQDPIRQLNAYYKENFYGQLELRPYSTPQMGEKGYIEVTLPGVAKDYSFGWLIGLESEDIPSLDPGAVQKLTLAIMAAAVQKHPEVKFQDKYIIVIMNAPGSEYGRGAAGVIPGDGAESPWDLFVGEVAEADKAMFSNADFFRFEGSKIIGMVGPQGYTYDDYFRDREKQAPKDQFILGLAMFGSDGPLSCATHDILHGLRRKSAYADVPDGRTRAVHCLYNLVQQSKWLVGTEEHGRPDRSVTVSPYIGWWDPMADHLHPQTRDFFASYPTGSCAFTKLRMGMIPQRCQAVAEQDDVTVKLAPLGLPALPAKGSAVETLTVKVPLAPRAPTLSHIYLLLEYRRRVGSETGTVHPDNFTIEPEFVLGDVPLDPGYNAANPAASEYVNPPTTFVPDEGVLVYLVNDKTPEVPGAAYTDWWLFNLVLLNPAGNDQRDNLNEAALDAGESLVVDGTNFIPGYSVPVKITVSVTERNNDYAAVHVVREYLR